MGSELEITAGGAIAVDPDQMRDVAARMAAVARRLVAAAEQLRRAHHVLSATANAPVRGALDALWVTAQRAVDLGEELHSDAVGTGIMADAFELADLRARQQMLAAHAPQAATLHRRIDELRSSYDQLDEMAVQLTAGWREHSTHGLLDQPADVLAGMLLRAPAMVPTWVLGAVLRDATRELGTIRSGTTGGGTAPPVTVAQTARSRVENAPRSLAQMMQRIPGGAAQVAVEKRTHTDGTVSFIAYIDGTRDLGSGSAEPWDMGSNWDLYVRREQSAAYAATLEALRQAGASPGDVVDVVGYSQGGAIAAAVATSGTFATKRVLIVGSPTVPHVRDDQTLIRIFHTDDPVGAGLSGGGPVGASGSAESFTVSREHATAAEVSTVSSHLRDAYDQTIADTDASGDVRVVALHENLRIQAQDIVEVERREFRAVRP